ncbi:MAG: hypothetical protein ACYC69_08890 [Thermodesulfovibrionales bacterium]
MAKKIAVLVRNRQSEALRMSVGLIMLDDEIGVIITEPLVGTDEVREQIEAIREFDVPTCSLVSGNSFDQISSEELAERLLRFDVILPY